MSFVNTAFPSSSVVASSINSSALATISPSLFTMSSATYNPNLAPDSFSAVWSIAAFVIVTSTFGLSFVISCNVCFASSFSVFSYIIGVFCASPSTSFVSSKFSALIVKYVTSSDITNPSAVFVSLM